MGRIPAAMEMAASSTRPWSRLEPPAATISRRGMWRRVSSASVAAVQQGEEKLRWKTAGGDRMGLGWSKSRRRLVSM